MVPDGELSGLENFCDDTCGRLSLREYTRWSGLDGEKKVVTRDRKDSESLGLCLLSNLLS